MGYNLLIRDEGAYGDQGFKFPAMRFLKAAFDQVWVSGSHWVEEVLVNTGLADGFIIKPEGFRDWPREERDRFLLRATDGIEFHAKLTTVGCIAGRLHFHKHFDPKADWPMEKKWKLAEGRNWFDEMSRWLKVPEAVGMRPTTNISLSERAFLRSFREAHGIPENAFLLGWQFTGSTAAKRLPYFYEVVQRGIMDRHPEVYVVGTGDLKGKVRWATGHGGRFINTYGLLSFREAYLLTSIMDCLVSPDTGIFILSQCFKTPKILVSCLVHGERVCCGEETIVLNSTAECSPCYNIAVDCRRDEKEPAFFYCATRIKPKRIIAAIEKVILQWRAQR